MNSRQNNIYLTEGHIIPNIDFIRYKIGDYVATLYYGNGGILCGRIQNILVSNQSFQILIDGSSELRTFKFEDIFGIIVK